MPNLWFELGELEDWRGYDSFLAQDARERIITEGSLWDKKDIEYFLNDESYKDEQL